MNTRIDDMMLMAYADGELTEDDARDIEAAIADDPDAQDRLKQFVDSAAWARAALAAESQPPVPERLSRLFAANDPAPRRTFWTARMAVAACVTALAVGTTLGWSARQGIGPAPFDGARLQAQIASVLETLPNGQVQRFEVSGTEGGITPVRTFLDGKGRFCREFALAHAGKVTLGLACRSPDGKWEVESALVRGQDAFERL